MIEVGQQFFFNPVNVVFGRGASGVLPKTLADKSVLIVSSNAGRKRMMAESAFRELQVLADLRFIDDVSSNPDLMSIKRGLSKLNELGRLDAIVAFGGGSVIDFAKVLSVAGSKIGMGYGLASLLASPELVSQVEPIPLYAVPTTAGTGSEVTPFATIWDWSSKKKLSLAGSAVFPRQALVDFEFLKSCPPNVSLSAGLDAVNQAFESMWNKNANEISLAIAMSAIRLGMSALPRIARGNASGQHYRDMAQSSLLAGMAISQTKTSICHAISYPITLHHQVEHGFACAFTMTAVLSRNLERDDGRFLQLERYLNATLGRQIPLISRVEQFLGETRVAPVVTAQIGDFERLVELEGEMRTPGRWGNHLLDVEDLTDVLRESWSAESA